MDESESHKSEEPYEGQVFSTGSAYWYGYDISYDVNTAPDGRRYLAAFFRQDRPTEEVVGHEWDVQITHTAWFSTLEEAKAAARAFADEMHWRREVENLGIGRELRQKAHEEALLVSHELRRVAETEPEKLNDLFRHYDQDKLWEQDGKNEVEIPD